MIDAREFIEREIMPIAGDFASDYDFDAILDDCREEGLVIFDERGGYMWADEEEDPVRVGGIMAAHDLSADGRGE